MSKDGSDWLGQVLADRYTVKKRIGAGGMGMVFVAHDKNLDTDVVVKVPHRSMLADEEFVKRFAQEIRSLVALSHPHVVKVMDVGTHDDVPFAVMQYLRGGDLKDRQPLDAQKRPRPEDPKTLANWLLNVAKALDFIHSEDFVHRDIKPDNILFDRSGNPFVGDFGIVKTLGRNLELRSTGSLTQKGMALGTPEYMAPEVVLGEKYDGRADQYALAATVFEVVCGRPPFQGNTPAAIIVQATTKSPPAPSSMTDKLSPDAGKCLLKALSRDPVKRYADCETFAAELLRLIEDPAQVKGRKLKVPPDALPDDTLTFSDSENSAPTDGGGHSPASSSRRDSQRDTSRRATETLKNQPPPVPPRKPTRKQKHDQTARVKSQDEATGKPPQKPKRRDPFGAAPPTAKDASPATKPKKKPPIKGTVVTTREEDDEPPTVMPGSIDLQRPPTTEQSAPVRKPPPPKPRPAANPPQPKPRIPAKPSGRETAPAAPKTLRRESPPQRPSPQREQPRRRREHHGEIRSKRSVVGLLLKIFGGLAIVSAGTFVVFWLFSNRAIVVARDGSGDYEKISEALKNVRPGGTIEIRKGRYREDRLDIDKPLTITGAGRDDVTINVKSAIIISSEATLQDVTVRAAGSGNPAPKGNGKATRIRRTVRVLPAAVFLQGIDAADDKAGGDKPGFLEKLDTNKKAKHSAIRVKGGKPTIRNCNIICEDGVGIVIEGTGTHPTITGCRIHRCGSSGIVFETGASGVIEDCDIESNRRAGVEIHGGNAELRKCRIKDIKTQNGSNGYGIAVIKGNPTIDECQITNVRSGILVLVKTKTTIRSCKVTKASAYGLRLYGNVDVSGKSEFAACSTGVFVGKTADARFDGCRVYDNDRQGVLISGKARLDNCSVYAQKGVKYDKERDRVKRERLESMTGRGVEISSGTGDAVISSTKIYGNKRIGLAVFGKATIENRCEIYKNEKECVYVHKTAELIARNSRVYDGKMTGVNSFGKVDISESEVTGNTGSGIFVRSGKTTITRCTLTKNGIYGVRVGSTKDGNVKKVGDATVIGSTIKDNKSGDTKEEIPGTLKIVK